MQCIKLLRILGVTFAKYLANVFNNNVVLGIAVSILQMGILFIVFIASTLLFKNIESDLYLKCEIIFLGCFVLPAEILCLLNVKNDILKPIQLLICSIILPIVLIADIIIYVYFVKILIISEIPSNRIFAIIAALFIFAGPTWIMLENFKEKNKFINANAKTIPYSFIPLICMQIYAISVRINAVGLTRRKIFRNSFNFI